MSNALIKEPFKVEERWKHPVSRNPTLVAAQVERAGDAHWLAAAPPATCVNLGCFTLFPSANFVIAGPHVGHNVGRAALLSSATVGAAMEAALAGHRAIAVSFSYYRRFGSWTPAELATAIQLAAGLCKQYWEAWPSDAVDVISINVPLGFRTNDPSPTPVVVCAPDPTARHRRLYAPVQPGSALHAWKPDEPPAPDMGNDVDAAHIMAGRATVTYLQARYPHVQL